MKIFLAEQIREWDQYTISHEPISSIDLMERASKKFTDELINEQLISKEKKVVVICGSGNNGGDGLVVARLLERNGYKIKVLRIASENYSSDNEHNFQKLLELGISVEELNKENILKVSEGAIIIDALLGSGVTKPLKGKYLEIVKTINKTKKEKVISVDLPSGLSCDGDFVVKDAIIADNTFTFQCPKLAFFFPESEKFIGVWKIVNIGLSQTYYEETQTPFFILNEFNVPSTKKRNLHAHKGTFGHANIIGGSYGKMGAVTLAAKAALRSGAGLVSATVPKCGVAILQTAIPEAMVRPTKGKKKSKRFDDIHDDEIDAIGIGPGLGTQKKTENAFNDFLLKKLTTPLVIDADALNLLAKQPYLLKKLPKNAILTPHPKEFERLFSVSVKNRFSQINKAIEQAKKLQVIIILKGAYTAICLPSGTVYFNTTGNSGMATGGMGDLLTGILTGFLAQKYSPGESALLGVYYHGYFGDKAYQKRKNALIPSDILDEMALG